MWIAVYWERPISHCAPMVGGTPIPPIRTGPLYRGGLAAMLQSRGVVLYLPVLITCPGVRTACVLLRSASGTNSVVWGVTSLIINAPEVATLSPIRGSIVVVMIRRVRFLNFFKSPLLVSITFIFFLSLVWVSTFGLLAGSPFASFAFADFDS